MPSRVVFFVRWFRKFYRPIFEITFGGKAQHNQKIYENGEVRNSQTGELLGNLFHYLGRY